MKVVVDANVITSLAIPLPYSGAAAQRLAIWKQSGVEIIAPALLEYEVALVLWKAITSKMFTPEDAINALHEIAIISVQKVLPTIQLHQNAINWVRRLAPAGMLDGEYLALAEQEGAELWTGNKLLAGAAQQAGVNWVHWIGESEG